MPKYAEYDGRSGRTVIVERPIPDPLWIWFGWAGPAEALVWRCFRCGAIFRPFDEAARTHAREHWTAAVVAGDAIREATARAMRAQAAADAASLAAARSAMAGRVAYLAAVRYLDTARARDEYRLYVARLEATGAAERGDKRRRWAAHYAAVERREALEESARAIGPLLASAWRYPLRLRGPEWRGLHRRRCVCERCAARYPERLADGLSRGAYVGIYRDRVRAREARGRVLALRDLALREAAARAKARRREAEGNP